MKKLKKLSLALAMLMTFSCLITSCKEPTESNVPEPEPEVPVEEDTGIELEETGYDIVSDKTTQYSIVIPADASGTLNTAANEMQTFIKEATGVNMNVVTDATVSDSAKVISLGDTALAKTNQISTNYAEVEAEGYKIITKDDDLYIVGYSDHGVLYGVYGYLEMTLNYDFFFTDVYTIDKVDTLPLYKYDVTTKPDIERRSYTYGFQRYNPMTMNRMRVRNPDDFIISACGSKNHNSLDILPVEDYGANGTVEKHSEWYSSDGTQLCFTAGGDETSFNRMVEVTTQILFDEMRIESNMDKEILSMNLEDQKTWCNCTACDTLIREKGNGACSATIVNFLNKVIVGLEDKLREAGDARADTFTLYTFAYFKAEAAPVKKEEDGTYSYDESMKMNKHFAVYYAPIAHPYANETLRGSAAGDMIEAWQAICDKVFLWAYNSYFYNWLVAYDSFNTIQDLYRFADEMGVSYLYVQGKQLNPGSDTGFSLLSAYLQSKFAWDVDADMNKLIDKFFAAMYGIEANNMRKFFNEWRAFSIIQFENGLSARPMDRLVGDPGQKALWPKSLITEWVNDLYAMIERLEKTGDTEAAYHVRIEAIFPLFTMAVQWKDELREDLWLKYALDLKAFVTEAGIATVDEVGAGETAKQLWERLGIQ